MAVCLHKRYTVKTVRHFYIGFEDQVISIQIVFFQPRQQCWTKVERNAVVVRR